MGFPWLPLLFRLLLGLYSVLSGPTPSQTLYGKTSFCSPIGRKGDAGEKPPGSLHVLLDMQDSVGTAAAAAWGPVLQGQPRL